MPRGVCGRRDRSARGRRSGRPRPEAGLFRALRILAATSAVSAIPAFDQVLGLSRGPASGTLVGKTAWCGLRSGARISHGLVVRALGNLFECVSTKRGEIGTKGPLDRCLEFGVASLVDSFEQLDDIGSVAVTA